MQPSRMASAPQSLPSDAREDHTAMNDGGKEAEFQVGEIVVVKDGPYAGFRGTVVEVRPQVLHLDVSVFGLPTRIEAAFVSVDRAVA